MSTQRLLDDCVKARKRKDAALEQYREAVSVAYVSGVSAYAIAKALGVNIRAVLDVLKRTGAKP